MTLFKKNNIIKLGSKVFFITLLLVYVIQLFFIQSYTVSSSQMENLFYNGDRILVNKIAYGLRLPITPLAIPFTFDNIFGIKSYSDHWQTSYRRLFTSTIEKNDIVLFNNPIDIAKPLDRRELLLSRCIGVSGDTLSFASDQLFINGEEYVVSPDALFSYKLKNSSAKEFKRVLDTQNIDVSGLKSDSAWTYCTLSKYQYFIVKNNFSDSIYLNHDYHFSNSISLVIPKVGMTIDLNEYNIPYYKMAILNENKDIDLIGDNLVHNGSIISTYTFANNYYWFMSDNVTSSIDSRSIGFVSEKFIIGRPFFVWYKSTF